VLVRRIAGCSPLLAREALVRSAVEADTPASGVSWDTVVTALRTLTTPLETHEWAPSVAERDGAPLEYAPYRLTQFPDAAIIPFETMSGAIRASDARPVRVQAFDLLKKPLLRALAERSEQARRKRGSLERTLSDAEQADELRSAGEAILASAHAIEPGASALQWEGRRIDLYPTLSAIENAEAYFRRYTAARDARRVVPPLLADVEAEIEHLDELALHVGLAASQRDIATLRAELENEGILRERSPAKGGRTKKAKTPSGLYRTVSIDGAQVLMGASAVGNDTITFKLAKPDDVWFHARGVPGAHVVLRSEGGLPPLGQLASAARLAASHSAARDAGKVEVDYTLKKYVRKARRGPPGQVTYANESTILVAAGDEEAADVD
jgi:predicted ribosome quality control (RQC) complex YloA/Tae2 family protein